MNSVPCENLCVPCGKINAKSAKVYRKGRKEIFEYFFI